MPRRLVGHARLATTAAATWRTSKDSRLYSMVDDDAAPRRHDMRADVAFSCRNDDAAGGARQDEFTMSRQLHGLLCSSRSQYWNFR